MQDRKDIAESAQYCDPSNHAANEKRVPRHAEGWKTENENPKKMIQEKRPMSDVTLIFLGVYGVTMKILMMLLLSL